MFTRCLVVDIGGANVEAGSMGTFTTVTGPMKLDFDDIGADHLPVYFNLKEIWNNLMHMIPFLLKKNRKWFISLHFVLPQLQEKCFIGNYSWT